MILLVCCTHARLYITGYRVFYTYFKIRIILIRRFLYCIRTRILSHVKFLVYYYFHRYLVTVFYCLLCLIYILYEDGLAYVCIRQELRK